MAPPRRHFDHAAFQVVHVPRGAVARLLGLDALLALLVLLPSVVAVDVALFVDDRLEVDRVDVWRLEGSCARAVGGRVGRSARPPRIEH